MPETPTFVVNDRRKFTSEGELRHDAPTSGSQADPAASLPEGVSADRIVSAPVLSFPQATATQAPEQDVLHISTPAMEQLSDLPESGALNQSLSSAPEADRNNVTDFSDELDDAENASPGPTDEESADALRAYQATVDRLDIAMRSADPGGERMPPMSFERLTQSLYTQALMLLGGGTQPGEQPRVDILGARQTIDMLSIVADKTGGNLSPAEDKLVQSALFDLRMGFLEITQALARQAAQRQPGGLGSLGGPGDPGGLGGFAGGPRIVR